MGSCDAAKALAAGQRAASMSFMALMAFDPERLRKWRFRALVGIGIVGVVFLLEITVFAPEPIPVHTTSVSRGIIDSTVTNSKERFAPASALVSRLKSAGALSRSRIEKAVSSRRGSCSFC